MYCAECGTANPIGAETCEVCGSPLGPSSGNVQCHVCSAPMDEHDRFCRACGQSQSGVGAGRFEPGPSFVDDSSLEVNPSELPPWLRDMTQAASQNGNGHATSSTPVSEPANSIPPWLDSTQAVNGAKHMSPSTAEQARTIPVQRSDEPAESFSLITEDDLPEWLRALGDQEFESDQQSIQPAASVSAFTSPLATVAPTISRAWLSRTRDTESESSETIAADFEPLESGLMSGLKRKTTPQTDELTRLGTTDEVVVVADEAVNAPAKANTVPVRIIVLSVVFVLVVILGYFAVSNFL